MEKRLGGCDSKLVFAEVTRHRITRQLEDTVWVKFINSTNRKLYALELIELSPEEEEDTEETVQVKSSQVGIIRFYFSRLVIEKG